MMQRLRTVLAAGAAGTAWALQGRTALAADAEPDPGMYFGDLGQAIATVLVFLGLFLLLRKYAWGPILAQLRKREQTVSDTLTQAQQRQEKAEQTLADYRGQLDRIGEEAKAILSQTRREASAAREHLLAQAREEAHAFADTQRRDIEGAKQDALRELYKTTAELATEMAAQVLRRDLTAEDHRRLLGETLDDVRRHGEGR